MSDISAEQLAANPALAASLPADSATAPIAEETTPETQATPVDAREAQALAIQAEDADAWESAKSILAEMRAARGKAEGETPEEPKAASVPAKVEPAKVEPPPAEDKSAEVLKRLNAAEARAREAEARVKAAEERIARAAEWEAAAKAAEEGDASAVFGKLKWTVDTVNKYLQGGPEALKPTVAEKKAETAMTEVERLRAELQAERNQRTVESYKATLAQELPTLAPKTPHFFAYYTGDDGKVDLGAARDAVWSYQVAMFNRKGPDGQPDPLELTSAQAAEALEELHAASAKKYARTLRAQPGSGAASPEASGTVSAQPVTPAKQRPLTRLPPPKTVADLEAEAEAEALAELQAARKARSTAAE